MAVEHKESFVAEAVNSFPGSVAGVVAAAAGDDGGVGNSFEADVGPTLDLNRERQGMMVAVAVDTEVG